MKLAEQVEETRNECYVLVKKLERKTQAQMAR
jgi:hypothetical protein